MLFNSVEFIFVFLPVTLAGFFILGGWSRAAGAAWLFLASLVFYAWWNPIFVILLLASIVTNFAISRQILRATSRGSDPAARQWLVAGIAIDLIVLIYYKYFNFILANLFAAIGTNPPDINVVLPIGISFFTFTQIAFLVDTYRRKAEEYNPIHYGLFVSYFPHLVAGPILHHSEMMPQFGNSSIYRANAKDIAAGLMMFSIGMFKKTIFADNIALVSNQIFADVIKVSSIDFLTAWQGALAYTLQIYFDFSGYSDMAIGLSLMMGVRLPINFNSPYKSGNIIEFWRRWHMTLSRFLKDYLYIPLGGNRFGANRRSLNLMATMLLGGLWHGAAWTFVAWGGLHGFYLLVNHSWRSRVHAVIGSKTVKSTAYVFLSSALTFLCVVFAWVPFRADSLDTATKMMWAMIGANGLPSFQQVGAWIVRLITSAPETLVGAAPWGLIPWLLLIAWLLPNSQQLLSRYQPALTIDFYALPRIIERLVPRLGTMCGVIFGVLLLVAMGAVLVSGNAVEFLYFNF